MERHIVHCDLDTFFVSVERLRNSRLVGHPVLIGGNGDRGVVASCSYEARRFGVHSAMPMKLARRLCPEAIVVRGDHDLYSKYSNLVTEIINERAPVVEKASIDEHYLDITGMDRYFGCWKWTRELRSCIMKETGLPISFGLSANKTVSKIATNEAKPCGERQVTSGSEKEFLAPLSVRKIPMVGEKAYTLLRGMGIHQIHALQQMDINVMRRTLGQNGIVIWRKANGEDDSPVVSFREQKSLSKEVTFREDTADASLLKQTLLGMADGLAFELRRRSKLTGCVTLKIRYSNFDTHTLQARIPYTNLDRVICEKVVALFTRIYNRHMFVRLVGIKFNHLITAAYQLDLFSDTTDEVNLMEAIDRIRLRFGRQCILRGICK